MERPKNRKQFYRQPQARQPGPTPGDAYLLAASAAHVPVTVHLLDGEVLAPATVKQVHTYTVLFEAEGAEHLVFKSAIKRISPVTGD